MEKLVRDKIPEIIESTGASCNYRIAKDAEEYLDFLLAKAAEELNEFIENPSSEEAADVMTVLLAIMKLKNKDITMNTIKEAYESKAISRGEFDKQIIATFNK